MWRLQKIATTKRQEPRAPAGQAEAGELLSLCLEPFGKAVKWFGALVITIERSVDEFFMHYFHNLPWLLAPGSRSGLRLWTPLGDGSPRPSNCPLLEKNPAGAVQRRSTAVVWSKFVCDDRVLRRCRSTYQSVTEERLWQWGRRLSCMLDCTRALQPTSSVRPSVTASSVSKVRLYICFV